MSKMSFAEKIGILLEISKSSKIFIIVIILLVFFGIILITTNLKNRKRNKFIYVMVSIFIIVSLIIGYHAPLSNMFDYMMDNFFIAVYFPNLAIYLAAIVATNIILWISTFNYKTSKLIKCLNTIIYIIIHYLLALILYVVNEKKLDIFNQSSIYGNKNISALIELSSLVFLVWIIFLIIYKAILIYIRKDYKPKVKKIIIKKKVKKLPENFESKEIPNYVYGKTTKKDLLLKPTTSEELLTKQIEQMLTLDDYKLLLKMLKEQKEKERIRKEQIKAAEQEQKKFLELQEMYRR